jgi:hypothetical protein
VQERRKKPLASSLELPEPQVGSLGDVKLLDAQVSSVTSSRTRHIIKRFLRRSGFQDVVDRHRPDVSFPGLRLVVAGRAPLPLTPSQLDRVKYLHDSVISILKAAPAGSASRSLEDDESLRMILAKVEPKMRYVYYGGRTASARAAGNRTRSPMEGPAS